MASFKSRIYYVPGVISLLVLPFIFYYFVNQHFRNSIVYAIPIVWADTVFLKTLSESTPGLIKQFPPLRHYTIISFNGDQLNNFKLQSARESARRMLQHQDTLSGLHFQFTDSATYGSFVHSIDMLRSEGAKTYMPLDNNLWIYYLPHDTTTYVEDIPIFTCGYFNTPWETTSEDQVTKAFIRAWTHARLLILLSLIFFSIVVVHMVRNTARRS